jgi:hypothetical protein
VVLALDDDIGLAESLRHIADLKHKMIGDVGAGAGVRVLAQTTRAKIRVLERHEALVQDGGILAHSVLRREDRR